MNYYLIFLLILCNAHLALAKPVAFARGEVAAYDAGRVTVRDEARHVVASWKSGPVRHMTFSPDGDRLVLAMQDDSVWMWRAGAAEPSLTPIHAAAVSLATDGKTLVLSTTDGVTAYQPATGQKLWQSLMPWGKATFLHSGCLVLSGDHTRVFTLTDKGEVVAFELRTGEHRTWSRYDAPGVLLPYGPSGYAILDGNRLQAQRDPREPARTVARDLKLARTFVAAPAAAASADGKLCAVLLGDQADHLLILDSMTEKTHVVPVSLKAKSSSLPFLAVSKGKVQVYEGDGKCQTVPIEKN